MTIIALEEHYSTQSLRDANAGHFLLRNPLVRDSDDARAGTGFAGAGRELVGRLHDLGERRLANMDAAGIDVQVLSQSTPGPENLEASLAVRLAAEANDVAAEAISVHPDRFAGFATLPTPDPRAAAKELERTVSGLGFVGALTSGHVRGRYLEDQFFWPVFEAAEALDVPIYLHPGVPPQAVIDAIYTGFSPMVNAALAAGAWGWHIDTGFHVLRLILGGVFDRFPGLQLIIGHMGEVLPSMIWRANWMLNGISGLDRPVQEYFTENIHITTSGVFDHAAFAAAVHAVGTDRILFSVDYPYSSNDEARAFLDGLPVSVPDREKIAHTNAERLLRLGNRTQGR
ncbi:amidohydrolase family protein [Streptomyces griseorubiginosus]|uniref:amidohydrolase family protein n=1 Tax=Streptomyces griseorubiginosus TaxID=67304 RepID=UPI001AD70A66|nr:amidohydrolase family protein [Streptomyces griseorubiginosus]MBO4252297.1 amidohydrolase family protein [Streptomyces griseorubiginosus]